MTSNTENIQELVIKNCDILNIATGVRAQNLAELRDALLNIHADSITHHFWATKLKSTFDPPEYNNDFANWAYEKLHDNKNAERLSLINPGAFSDIEKLRAKLIEVVELSLEENSCSANTKDSEKFQFTRSQIVLFNTNTSPTLPEELILLIPELPMGSIYYHFVIKKEEIIAWILQFGKQHEELVEQLKRIDPYFYTLSEYRERLAQIFTDYFGGASK